MRPQILEAVTIGSCDICGDDVPAGSELLRMSDGKTYSCRGCLEEAALLEAEALCVICGDRPGTHNVLEREDENSSDAFHWVCGECRPGESR